MNVFDILREKLRKESVQTIPTCEKDGYSMTEEENMIFTNDAIEIVNQVEQEYNNGWIPCSERLPDGYCRCLVTRRNDYEDGSFDSDVREDVYIELEGVWGWQSKFEGLIDNIIAWKPLPPKYEPKGE